jgi:hypothetical protein
MTSNSLHTSQNCRGEKKNENKFQKTTRMAGRKDNSTAAKLVSMTNKSSTVVRGAFLDVIPLHYSAGSTSWV